MTADRPLLEVGRIGRAHGVRGELVVTLVTNNLDRVAPGAVLDAEGTALTVVTSRPYKGDKHVVAFAGVSDRAGAEALVGTLLRAEPVDDPDAYWVHDLLGATVVDVDGVERGVVVEVLANPASDVLVLDTGPLVPLRFATWDDEGRLVVDGPDGLL